MTIDAGYRRVGLEWKDDHAWLWKSSMERASENLLPHALCKYDPQRTDGTHPQ